MMETAQTLKVNNKVILKGKIMEVQDTVEVGEKKTKKQVIIFCKPAYFDGFETQGKDQFWQLVVLGDAIARLSITRATHYLKKATVVFYVDSNQFESKDNPLIMNYAINATLTECILFKEKE